MLPLFNLQTKEKGITQMDIFAALVELAVGLIFFAICINGR